MTDFTRGRPVISSAGWGWTLAYGIVSVLIGILAFSAPFPATLAATVVVGFFFLVGGIASLVAGFSSRNDHRGYSLFVGLLSVLVGGYMVFAPVGGALSLTLMVIVWLGARGITEILVGMRVRRLRVPMLALGALNLLLAVLLFGTVPWSALTLPGYVLGASFLFGGIVSILGALAQKRGE